MTDKLSHTIRHIRPLDAEAMRAAEARQLQLTKPPKALGRLETLSIQLAGIQGQAQPVIEQKAIAVMAADHGVTAEGVSAFPAEVTPAMVLNFAAGGAAINVIGRHVGARVLVTDVGVNADLSAAEGVRHEKIRMGTANMAQGPAMSREEAIAAIDVGIELVDEEFAKASRHHRHRRDGHRQHHGRLRRDSGSHRRAGGQGHRPRHGHQQGGAAGQGGRHREGPGREQAGRRRPRGRARQGRRPRDRGAHRRHFWAPPRTACRS